MKASVWKQLSKQLLVFLTSSVLDLNEIKLENSIHLRGCNPVRSTPRCLLVLLLLRSSTSAVASQLSETLFSAFLRAARVFFSSRRLNERQ